jgi:MFS family permease
MRQHRLVIVLAGMIGLSAAGYGVMFTVLDDMRETYGIGEGALGALVAVGFFASFAAQVLLAPLADRGRARQLLIIGLALQVVGLCTMAAGRSLLPLMLARVVMGVGAGMLNPAARRIVVVADPDNLGRNIGRLLAADVVGFALGPAVSALLVDPFGIAAPFLMMAAFAAAFLPVALRTDITEHVDESSRAHFAFDLLRNRAYVATLCFGAAVFLMIGTFDVLWVLVLDDLGAADWIANLGIITFALPLAILGPIGGRLAQQTGPFRTAAIGLLVGAVFMASYGHWPTGGTMFAASLFHAVNDGLTVSSAGVAVAMVAPAGRQAGAQGLLGGVQTLVGGMSALVTGALYERAGRVTAYTTSAVAMALLVLIALVLLGRSWTQRPTPAGAAAEASGSPPAEQVFNAP